MEDKNIGQKFGRRTALRYSKTTRIGDWYIFQCECGQEKELPLNRVKNGRQQQCAACKVLNAKRDRLARKLHWLAQVDERFFTTYVESRFANDYDSKT